MIITYKIVLERIYCKEYYMLLQNHGYYFWLTTITTNHKKEFTSVYSDDRIRSGKAFIKS